MLLYPMFQILKCLIFSVFNLETFMKPLVQFYKSENHSWRNVTLKLQPEACNFTKSNTPPWVFFTFFKLYKSYQMVQSIKNMRFWQLLKIKNQVENCHQEIRQLATLISTFSTSFRSLLLQKSIYTFYCY